MSDKRSEIQAIIEGLEQEFGTEEASTEPAEGLDGMAKIMVQYYDALIEAGLGREAALALLMQWHLLMWARALSMGKDSA